MGLPKIEGQSQCTGEAEYVNDMPPQVIIKSIKTQRKDEVLHNVKCVSLI
jgi:hypothetical protein